MSFDRSINAITWARFEDCNSDTTKAFENMCRVLFRKQFLVDNIILHSEPNNAGIEVLPVPHKDTGKMISFQSKYLSTMDYDQIKHSAEKTVEYYAGQIDIVFLYCNKDVTTTSKSFREITQILADNNIELVPITNNEILDHIISNPIISNLYFQNHSLSREWFDQKFIDVTSQLGRRYNPDFNVVTNVDRDLELFALNENAILYVNNKKAEAINTLSKIDIDNNVSLFCNRICDEINLLDDIEYANFSECLKWKDTITERCNDVLLQIQENIDNDLTAIETSDNDSEKEIEKRIKSFYDILDALSLIELSKYERTLITNKVLFITGDAGNGKTHTIATFVDASLKNGHAALMCLGNSYLSDNTVDKQIVDHLNLDFDIVGLFDVLNGIGEIANKTSLIFFDAINESNNINIWKQGLLPLINKVNQYNNVKLVFSLRMGYEPLIFDDCINSKIESGQIVRIVHKGFLYNQFDAIKAFLDYYNIHFSPVYYLRSEMTKPLFLKLFCENNSAEKYDIFSLFDKMIENANTEAMVAAGKNSTHNLLAKLLDELADTMLKKYRSIDMDILYNASFWGIYGLNNKKIEYISALETNGLLIRSAYNGEEKYYLGYNLLEDYICAKWILKKYKTKDDLRKFIIDDLLLIKNGQIEHTQNEEVYIVLCSLFAEKYHEECIDIIDDVEDNDYLIEQYISSFSWRKPSSINADALDNFISTHYISKHVFWDMLIDNSTKVNHPLNAKYLHQRLMKYTLAKRDAIWTTFANDLHHQDNRVWQIVNYYFAGGSMQLDEPSIELLLILFAWILTSSNRRLRDKTSKAMIEILKSHFNLCLQLLSRFKSVNDPYIIQRLYGIVFGACLKRTDRFHSEFIQLANYVYDEIFTKETVYPDILLRDYARLIIERYCFEYPKESSEFDKTLICPPYKSEAIPLVNYEEQYGDKANYYGLRKIAMSMRTNHDHKAMYGDFGRYIFQSALNDFLDVDIENVYHYAMQFIRDKLGYSDELFANYEQYIANRSVSRHDSKKTERIGKKYQWIAMYNILARISDTHMIGGWGIETHQYRGAWEPYVRDFDPTLNINSMTHNGTPQFVYDSHKTDDDFIVSTNEKEIKTWAKKEPSIFRSFNDKLLVQDTTGQMWILLYKHEKVNNSPDNRNNYDEGSQEIWSISQAYFVKNSEFETIKNYLQDKNFIGRYLPEARQFYSLFNREYAWAPGCDDEIGEEWLELEVQTDELVEYDEYQGNKEYFSICNQPIFKRKVIGELLPAYISYIWEEEYDASQEESTSFYIPCKQFISHFSLEQKEYDGYFYALDGELIALDRELSGSAHCFAIRKDYVDKFLYDYDLKLVWSCFGEKQYFLDDFRQIHSEWGGFLYLESDTVKGRFENKDGQPYIR